MTLRLITAHLSGVLAFGLLIGLGLAIGSGLISAALGLASMAMDKSTAIFA